jgi:predicted nucleic acid-binding protein
VASLLLDTNVFLYAIGGESAQREPCRALLVAVGEGRLDGVTNSEVLQEILHVRGRRVSRTEATQSVREAAALVREVLSVERADVLLACDLIEHHPRLGARDALHVATMKNAGITLIASVDGDFDALPGIQRMGPEEALQLAV